MKKMEIFQAPGRDPLITGGCGLCPQTPSRRTFRACQKRPLIFFLLLAYFLRMPMIVSDERITPEKMTEWRLTFD